MPEAASPAIVLKDLEKYYPPQRSGLRAFLQPFERATRPALKGVSLEVQQGQAVALLGANGAGKSTILRILATLLLPTRGQAIVAGCDTIEHGQGLTREEIDMMVKKGLYYNPTGMRYTELSSSSKK